MEVDHKCSYKLCMKPLFVYLQLETWWWSGTSRLYLENL